MKKHFQECYDACKLEMGDNFDKIMAETCIEILNLQYKCKEGTTFASAGMTLMLPTVNMTKEEHEEWQDRCKIIKAAMIWDITNGPII